MLGYRLFRHALLMLLDNISVVIRLSVLPFLVFFAIGYGVFLSVGGEPALLVVGSQRRFIVLLLVVFLSYIALLLWIAVGWHRYVLVEQEPGPAWPRWEQAFVRAYLGAWIRLIPLTLLTGFAAAMVVTLFAVLVGQNRVATNDGTVAGFILNLLISFFLLRLSLVLPAAAVGNKMRVPESWRRTRPLSGAVFIAALCIAVLTQIPNFLLQTPLAPVLSTVSYSVVANWFLFMLGISIMTTLYGHIVEDRPLR